MRVLVALDVDAERREGRRRCLSRIDQRWISWFFAVTDEVNDVWLSHDQASVLAGAVRLYLLGANTATG